MFHQLLIWQHLQKIWKVSCEENFYGSQLGNTQFSRWWGSTTVTNWNFGISKFYRSLKIDAAAGCINLTYQKTLRSDIHYPAHQREMKARIHKHQHCMHRNFVTKLSIFLFLTRFDMTHLAYNSFKFRITFIIETSCFKDNLPIIQQDKRKSEVVPVLVSISISAAAPARSPKSD